jgi:hypothetical protein
MTTIRWAVSLVAASLLVGCADKPKPEAQTAFSQGSPVSIDEARVQFKTANPMSSVGIVKSNIRADQGLIAAGELPPESVAIGDAVSIVAPDTKYTLIANGVVRSFNGSYAIISITDARRVPEIGDFVVRLPLIPHSTAHTAAPGLPATAPAAETPAVPAAPAPSTETPAPAAPAPAPAVETPAPVAPAAPAPSTTETPKPADNAAKPVDLNK